MKKSIYVKRFKDASLLTLINPRTRRQLLA